MGIFDKWIGKKPAPAPSSAPPPPPSPVVFCEWCKQGASSLTTVTVDVGGLSKVFLSMGPCCRSNRSSRLEYWWSRGAKCACGKPAMLKAKLYYVIRPGVSREVAQAFACGEHIPAAFWSGPIRASEATLLPGATCEVCQAKAVTNVMFESSQPYVAGTGICVDFCQTHAPAKIYAAARAAKDAAQQKARAERMSRARGKAYCFRCKSEQPVYSSPCYDAFTDAKLDDSYNCVTCDGAIDAKDVRR